jgi:hypothetical protein
MTDIDSHVINISPHKRTVPEVKSTASWVALMKRLVPGEGYVNTVSATLLPISSGAYTIE